jgi:hypothetical protein
VSDIVILLDILYVLEQVEAGDDDLASGLGL